MADQKMVQSSPIYDKRKWERTNERHMLWEQNATEERQSMRMLVDKIWFLMSEMNRGPGYHIYHHTCLHLKKTRGMDKWMISAYKI